jgi:hypothetical protein
MPDVVLTLKKIKGEYIQRTTTTMRSSAFGRIRHLTSIAIRSAFHLSDCVSTALPFLSYLL